MDARPTHSDQGRRNMTLTLLEEPDLIGIYIAAPAFTASGKGLLHDVDGVALFNQRGELKKVALCVTDDEGRECFEVLDNQRDPMSIALRQCLWVEASRSSTRTAFDEQTSREASPKRRQPTEREIYGTYYGRP